jgi:hypothetical protein
MVLRKFYLFQVEAVQEKRLMTIILSTSFVEIFGITEDELEDKWIEYIKEKYSLT